MDYLLIEKLHAAARRERSEYVHCLLVRARSWFLAWLHGTGGSLQAEPCC